MAKPYELLRSELSTERRAANEARAAALLRAAELREAILAAEAEMQAQEGDLPGATALVDAYLHALKALLEQRGGHLQLVAKFPEGETEIEALSSFREGA